MSRSPAAGTRRGAGAAIRSRLPPRRCSESEFDTWLRAATERADPAMAWLGILFALLVGYEIAVDLERDAEIALQVAGWAIWALFLAEFAAKLWLAPHKARFVVRHPTQWIGLLLPALRFLRFMRLVRLGRALPAARVVASSYRGAGATKRLLRSRLAYLGALSAIAAIALAEIAFVFERGAPNAVFDDFGETLIWAASTILALQGDPVPETVGAQIAMLGGFAFGLVIVASLAATLGAFLVESREGPVA